VVSAVLGSVLMIGVSAAMVPSMIQTMGAYQDALQAQREASEHWAYCARHPFVTTGPYGWPCDAPDAPDDTPTLDVDIDVDVDAGPETDTVLSGGLA